MIWVKAIILFIAPLMVGLSAFKIKKYDQKYIKLMLAFSGSYLLGITVIELIPSLFRHQHGHFDFSIGIFMLIGFLIQIVLDVFSKGVEHGHMHTHDNAKKGFITSVTFGLCLHAFMEGIPLGGHEHFHNHSESLLAAIALHKLPAAFALVTILLHSNKNQKLILLSLFLFALMSPLSMLLMDSIESFGLVEKLGEHTLDYIFAIVIGSFLHISTTILFESSSKMHSFSFTKVIAIIAGVLVAYLTV